MNHYLVVVEGTRRGESVRLGPEPVVLGRKEPSDLVLEDPRISRTHCRVWLQDDQAMVLDLGSTNGTYVNDKVAVGPTPLPAASRLEIGSHILAHELRAEEA